MQKILVLSIVLQGLVGLVLGGDGDSEPSPTSLPVKTVRVKLTKKVFVTADAEYKANFFFDMEDHYVIKTDDEQVTLKKSEVLNIKEVSEEVEKVVAEATVNPQPVAAPRISPEDRKNAVSKAKVLFDKGQLEEAERLAPGISRAYAFYKEGYQLIKVSNVRGAQKKWDEANGICPGIAPVTAMNFWKTSQQAWVANRNFIRSQGSRGAARTGD